MHCAQYRSTSLKSLSLKVTMEKKLNLPPCLFVNSRTILATSSFTSILLWIKPRSSLHLREGAIHTSRKSRPPQPHEKGTTTIEKRPRPPSAAETSTNFFSHAVAREYSKAVQAFPRLLLPPGMAVEKLLPIRPEKTGLWANDSCAARSDGAKWTDRRPKWLRGPFSTTPLAFRNELWESVQSFLG